MKTEVAASPKAAGSKSTREASQCRFRISTPMAAPRGW